MDGWPTQARCWLAWGFSMTRLILAKSETTPNSHAKKSALCGPPGLFVSGLIRQLSSFRDFVLDLLFGQGGCEVFHLKDLADFDFVVAAGVAIGAALDPVDGLFEGLDLQDREAGDEILGLSEGAVDDGTRLAGEFDACAFGAGVESIERKQDASLAELFVVLAHLEQELWIGEGAFFFCLRGCFDDDHESHCGISFGLGGLNSNCERSWIAVARSLLIHRTRCAEIDMRTEFY